METIYEQLTTWNKANLIKKLVNLKYKEGCNIIERTSKFKGLVDQLTTMNNIINDKLQALLLFSFLSDSWEALVVLVNNSAANGKSTLDMIIDRLRNKEYRRMGIEIVLSESNALVLEKQEKRGTSQSRNSPCKTMIILQKT